MIQRGSGCVPDLDLSPRSALCDLAAVGRIGSDAPTAGVVACERAGLSLATVTLRRGGRESCRAALAKHFAVELPAVQRITYGQDLALAWSGPEQFFAVAPRGTDIEARLRDACGGRASVVDQTGGRFALRLGGARVRDALAKGVAIDLHPRAFATGDTAVTMLGHVVVQIWQVDAQPTYDLVGPRAVAGDVWHWLAASAAEYGLDVSSPC